MTRTGRPPARGLALPAACAVGALVSLSGCTTLGTNVKGSFSCSAPGGTCAPSTVIDDAAIASIQQQSATESLSPAGPYQVDDGDKPRQRMAALDRGRAPAPALSAGGGRVLRIVFPAFVDRYGRLHEKTAVQAVVDPGGWSRGLAGRGVQPAGGVPGVSGLLGAAESAPTMFADAGAPPAPEVGPQAPPALAKAAPPAVVPVRAAASAGPLDAIKTDVAKRLKAGRVLRTAASFPAVED